MCMFTDGVVRRIELLLGATIFAVAVFVTPNASLDPINAPKLWVLSSLSIATGFLLLSQFGSTFNRKNIKVLFSGRALFVWMLLAMFLSSAPIAQQLFGVNGRNTGLLAYFCFGTLFIAAALVPSKQVVRPILIGSGASFAINAI